MQDISPAAPSSRAAPQPSAERTFVETPLVALDGAGLERDGHWLVRGIDLQVRPGEIVTLIGPNGSGKSTTARLALGLLAPSEGRAVRRPGLKVGYVPQRLAIDWTMPLTVARFVALTKALPRPAIASVLERVGVERLADADLRKISGGEFQRVLLARALALEPELLVLDEPVQGVDVAGEAALYDLIDAIRRERGCGVLLISHDLHVVMAATDTVLCLDGTVRCRGTPERVRNDAAYAALFGPRSRHALALYGHDHHHHDHAGPAPGSDDAG